MTDQKDFDCAAEIFSWNKWLLSKLGLWPAEKSDFRFFLNFGYFMYHMVLEYLDLFLFIGNLEHVIMNLTENMAFSQIIVRLLMLRVYASELGQVVSEAMTDLDIRKYKNEEEKELILAYNSTSKAFVKLLMSNVALTATSYYFQPILGQIGSDLIEDPLAVKEFRNYFLHGLGHGISVGAFVDNPDEEKCTLAGLNILYFGGKEKMLEFKNLMKNFKSEKMRKIMKAFCMCVEHVNVEKIYGTENCIGGLGLSVEPSFRGNALGYHLLLARNEIGKQHNIVITTTIFTTPISSKIADRAGFTILFEKLCDELVDDKGEMLLPNCETESFKFMGKRLA